MNKITQIIEYRKSVIKYAKNKGVPKALEEFNVSIATIYRWIKKFDGTNKSLLDKSRRPYSHPNQHTEEELRNIRNYKAKNKKKGLVMFWLKLREKTGYSRSIVSLYRAMIRLGIYKKTPSKKKQSENRKYKQATYPGEKIQVDVKYVPTNCMLKEDIENDIRYYQYTAIDEYSRQRVVMATKEHSTYESAKFVKLIIKKFKFNIETVQTDNGLEFTNRLSYKADRNTKTFFEKELELNNIKHKLIKPRTPKQNGKVERSHRKDQENLYYEQKFLNFEDFKRKLSRWIREYNNTGMKPLNWKSPNQFLEEYIKLTAEK